MPGDVIIQDGMTETVVIMVGISGSGKSTYIAEKLPAHAAVVSADSFFHEAGGGYEFDPAKLPEAHGACLRRYVELLGGDGPPVDLLVVDNTNTSIAELAPYAALAQAYGWDLKVVVIECDPAVAHRRNLHGVPAQVIDAQHKRLQELVLPSWWTRVDINQAEQG